MLLSVHIQLRCFHGSATATSAIAIAAARVETKAASLKQPERGQFRALAADARNSGDQLGGIWECRLTTERIVLCLRESVDEKMEKEEVRR